MKVLIALVCTTGAVALLSSQIRRFPVVFYGAAALLDGFLLYAYSYPVPAPVWDWLLEYVQRCLFGQALLVIVMFIGVLGDGSRLKAGLLPIRGELSIMAAILVIGHAVPHLPFLARVLGNLGTAPADRAVSFFLSTILLALLIVLTVTSLRSVRRRIAATVWKSIQKLAYPFFALIYVHLVLVLLKPALAGAFEAMVSIGVYTGVFLAYGLLRGRKALAVRVSACSRDE